MRTVFTLPEDLEQLARMDAYPGVIPEESRPLREFLKRHGARFFQEIRFDVRVGPSGDARGATHPETRKAWEHVTRMRVDAVGFRPPNDATLIEAKHFLGNDGVWQLLAYRDAYSTEFPSHLLRLVLVAEAATLTAVTLAQQNGIAVFLYTFAPDTIDVTAPATEERASGI